MTPDEVASGRTFPAIDRIRDVSHSVAVAVIQVALDADLTTKITREQVPNDDALNSLVAKKMYDPQYVPLVDPKKY
jgi:malic enzyme